MLEQHWSFGPTVGDTTHGHCPAHQGPATFDVTSDWLGDGLVCRVRQGMREIARVLRDGGVHVFTVPRRRREPSMVAADLATPTAAGRAFAVVRSWLLGTRPAGCSRDRAGTYTCAFKANNGSLRRTIWNPARNVAVPAPSRTTSYVTISGVRRPGDAAEPPQHDHSRSDLNDPRAGLRERANDSLEGCEESHEEAPATSAAFARSCPAAFRS